MSTSILQQSLRDQVESTKGLDPRYSNIKCINLASDDNDRRGCLSLIFQAYDSFKCCDVALKFMDPERHGDIYRLASFHREPDILGLLDGQNRCLNITQPLTAFPWEIQVGDDNSASSISVDYFATEWLDGDIDDYFFQSNRVTPLEKLSIFRKILLAIEAIHRNDIFHRDIKYRQF